MGIRKISTCLPNGGGGSKDWNIRQDCRREDSKELCSEFAIHIANSVQGALLELYRALGLSGTRLPSGFFKEIRADTWDPFSSLLSAPCSCPGPMQGTEVSVHTENTGGAEPSAGLCTPAWSPSSAE